MSCNVSNQETIRGQVNCTLCSLGSVVQPILTYVYLSYKLFTTPFELKVKINSNDTALIF